MSQMILFFSDFCPHSRMLLETIKKMNATFIKLASMEALIKAGKQIPQIHSVPALMILPQKQVMFGKQVFDFLLRPGSGILVTQRQEQFQQQQQQPQVQQQYQQQRPSEPMAFTMQSGGLSDLFSPIEGNTPIHNNNMISGYTPLDQVNTMLGVNGGNTLNEETRSRKGNLPDMSEIQARRDMEAGGSVRPHPMSGGNMHQMPGVNIDTRAQRMELPGMGDLQSRRDMDINNTHRQQPRMQQNIPSLQETRGMGGALPDLSEVAARREMELRR